MTPELCRNARKALSLRYEELAAEVGVRPVTLMKYELGKQIDAATVAKLGAFFGTQQISVLSVGSKAGQVVRYTRYTDRSPDVE